MIELNNKPELYQFVSLILSELKGIHYSFRAPDWGEEYKLFLWSELEQRFQQQQRKAHLKKSEGMRRLFPSSREPSSCGACACRTDQIIEVGRGFHPLHQRAQRGTGVQGKPGHGAGGALQAPGVRAVCNPPSTRPLPGLQLQQRKMLL